MAASATIIQEQVSSKLRGVKYDLYLANCLEWMDSRPAKSIHAIVTDPPYELKEYTATEKHKLRKGKGGVWRIPPSFDGCTRSPVPRFTILSDDERAKLKQLFSAFSRCALRVLVPGGHLFIATNPLLSHLVYVPLMESGFEKRGEIIRLVQTLRGGDRPKNAHKEFSEATVMPRSGWEPRGGISQTLRGSRPGQLTEMENRRASPHFARHSLLGCNTFFAHQDRGAINHPHPSLKPQSFMRQIVRASLPLGEELFSIRSREGVRRLQRRSRSATKAAESSWTRRSSDPQPKPYRRLPRGMGTAMPLMETALPNQVLQHRLALLAES